MSNNGKMFFEKLRQRFPETVEKVLPWLAGIFAVAGLTIIIWFSCRLWIHGVRFYGNLDNEVSSQVGTFIGGVVGPLWTLATFFVLYLTFTRQSKQIEEQLKEQRYSKFESTFFNLIRTQQELTNNISITKGGGGSISVISGRHFFSHAETDLRDMYKCLLTADSGQQLSSRYRYLINDYNINIDECQTLYGQQDSTDAAKKIYGIFFRKQHPLIGHYFRHLYQILKFIDDAKAKEIARLAQPSDVQISEICDIYMQYAGFIQAQMSVNELFVLFYNQLCFPKMTKFVEEYNLLENLPYENLIYESHRTFYNGTLKSIDIG